jgi:hypothetical protein
MQANSLESRDGERRGLGEQMAMLGVRLLNKYGRILQCVACDEIWGPQTAADGSFRPGFWRCPNKCNW